MPVNEELPTDAPDHEGEVEAVPVAEELVFAFRLGAEGGFGAVAGVGQLRDEGLAAALADEQGRDIEDRDGEMAGGLREGDEVALLLHVREAADVTGGERHGNEPAVKLLGEHAGPALGAGLGQDTRQIARGGKQFREDAAGGEVAGNPRPAFEALVPLDDPILGIELEEAAGERVERGQGRRQIGGAHARCRRSRQAESWARLPSATTSLRFPRHSTRSPPSALMPK